MSTTDNCPHCKKPLTHIQKMSGSWFECVNKKCSYLKSQKPRSYTIRGISYEEDFPLPFTTGYKDH